MKIYRNHYKDRAGKSRGFSFHTSEISAHAAAKEKAKTICETEGFDCPLTRDGLIHTLNRLASHPKN